MTTVGVSGQMFLLIPAHLGYPDKFQRAVKCVHVLDALPEASSHGKWVIRRVVVMVVMY